MSVFSLAAFLFFSFKSFPADHKVKLSFFLSAINLVIRPPQGTLKVPFFTTRSARSMAFFFSRFFFFSTRPARNATVHKIAVRTSGVGLRGTSARVAREQERTAYDNELFMLSGCFLAGRHKKDYRMTAATGSEGIRSEQTAGVTYTGSLAYRVAAFSLVASFILLVNSSTLVSPRNV